MSTSRTLRQLQARKSPPTDKDSSSPTQSSLSERGYSRNVESSGLVVYKSPTTEYDAYRSIRDKIRNKGTYSDTVITFDQQGRVVKEEKYSPVLTEAMGSQVWREARKVEEKVYDYEKGVVTTQAFDPTNRNTSLAQSQRLGTDKSDGVSKGEYERQVEANRQAKLSNVKSTSKDLKTGIITSTLRSPTFEEPYKLVQQRSQEKREAFLKQLNPSERTRIETEIKKNPKTIIIGVKTTQEIPFEKNNSQEAKDIFRTIFNKQGEPLGVTNLKRKESILYNPDIYNKQRMTFKEVTLEFSKGLSEDIISFGKGTIKILDFKLQNPTPLDGMNLNPEVYKANKEIRAKQLKSFRELIQTDSDVKIATVGGVLLAGSIASPIVAGGMLYYGTGIGLYSVVMGISNKDPRTIGRGVFDLGTGASLKIFTTRPFIEITKTKVKAEDIFGAPIGKQSVTSKSTIEALRQFERGRVNAQELEVVTAGPTMLRGGSKVEVVAGPKGFSGIEDAGIFVGPKGAANIMFTGLGKSSVESSLSFVPEFFKKTPVVSTVIVKDVVLPRNSVLLKSGFSNVNKEFLGQGVAVISKRSMIGKGEVPRQLYRPTSDIYTDGGLVRLKNKLYRESGTSETEAVIPEASILNRESVDSFTVVNQFRLFGKDIPLTGDLILLPRYRLETTPDLFSLNKKSSVSFKKLVAQQDSYYINSFGSRRVSVLRGGIYGLSSKSSSSSKKLLSDRFSSDMSSAVTSEFSSGYSFSSSKSLGKSVGNSLRSFSNFSQSSGLSQRFISQAPVSRLISSPSQGYYFSGAFPSKSIVFTPIKIFPPSPPKYISRFSSSSSKSGVGFDVLVKEGSPKGKKTKKIEVKVNKKPLPYNRAWNTGSEYTDNTSARSFRLVKRGKTKLTDDFRREDLNKYRASKSGRYAVEKSTYAIDSFGELQGITAKGLKAQRNKRNKSFNNIFAM